MFWDKKKLEEQRKKLLLENEKKRQQGLLIQKKKKAQKKLKRQRQEEEEQERAARDEAEAAKEKEKDGAPKKVFVPSLNRGFGMDLGGKSIVEKMMQPPEAAGKEPPKAETKSSGGWSPRGGDEPEGKGGAGTGNIPKLPRPF